jgi:hypothetical protein
MSATDATLELFGLPPRPDPTTEPDLFTFWNLMLSKPLKIIQPAFDIQFPLGKELTFRYRLDHPRPTTPFSSSMGHRESSRNWSGTYIVPPFPDRFIKVIGAWHLPKPDVPRVPPDPPNASGLEFRSSTWVGLDGHRTYPHASMPQAGTAQRVDVGPGGKVTTYAWWQWWSKDGDTVEVEITNVPSVVGDQILVALTVVASDEVQFNLKNQTTGDFVTFLVQAPAGSPPIGATAEWVMERPAEIGSTWLYRLPNYGVVNFTHCVAQSGPGPLRPSRLHSVDHSRLIRMFEIFETPYRPAFVSIPKITGPTRLNVEYREAS